MKTALLIIIVVCVTELVFHPRIDITSEGDVLLWWGSEERHYIVLFKIEEDE
jgi:hypothetical protein